MSLIFFDGFETYATADILKDWTLTSGAVSINATGGRRGSGAAYAPNNSAAGYITKTLPAAVSTVIVGFSLNLSALPTLNTRSVLRLLDAGTQQFEINVNIDGTLSVSRNATVLATSAGSIPVASDQYIELKVTIHDTLGAFELRLNGNTILSATNVDTKNTANAFINGVSLGPQYTVAVCTAKYDDFYVLDTSGATNNDFLGDVRIDAIYPNADGAYTSLTPSTGSSHFALVDEATPNTTDYNSSSTPAAKDSYGMTSPPVLTSEIIFAVRAKVAALKDDTGARSIKVGVRSGAVDSVSAAQALSTTQLYYSNIHETDPNTGAAWLPAGVDALETLVEIA
jgi:hypothetical protein